MEYTDNQESPDLYHKWCAVHVVAAALQRKCFLNWGYITFYPNFYIVLVGPAGKCRKGTAMGPAYNMMRDLSIKMAAESITREALVRELKQSSGTQIDPVDGKMYLHASLSIFSPELVVFLGHNNQQLISDLTDWYDCRERWTYRTKNMGTDDITGVWVNLLGATTPDLLQTTLPLNAIGGGLTSRMIFVFERNKRKVVPIPFVSNKNKSLGEVLTADLEKINMISGQYRITTDFLDTWIDWYTAQEGNPPFNDQRFAGYIERRPTHVLKLSMIMNTFRADGDQMISKEDLLSSIALIEATEKNMPHTFGGVGKSQTVDVTNKVLICLAEKKSISMQELIGMFYHDADRDTMDKVISTLQGMGAARLRVSGTTTYIDYTYHDHAQWDNTDNSPLEVMRNPDDE